MNKPKFSTTLLLLIGVLLLLPLFAAAAPTITETSVKLTADYSKFADEDDDFIVVTTESFTVVNDVDAAIEVTVKVNGLPSGYKSDPQTVTVPAFSGSGGIPPKTVTLTIEVPHKNSPGTEKIGTIVITDSSGNTDSADLVQET